MVSPDVGGSFGAKGFPYPEELLCPWLARRVGRPVRWFETRTENMLGLGHGRGQVQDVTIGGTRDGHVSPTASRCCRTPAPTPASRASCRS